MLTLTGSYGPIHLLHRAGWTAPSSDCCRPVNHYVRLKTADLYRPNARFIPERQRYQVLTPFGKLGYSHFFV